VEWLERRKIMAVREFSLTTCDLNCCDEVIIDDRQLVFEWELWFDVDKYFGTHIKENDNAWINFYTYYDIETKEVTAKYAIDDLPYSYESYDWHLTDKEKEYLECIMKQYVGGDFEKYYYE
jgi:hypothetical protein